MKGRITAEQAKAHLQQAIRHIDIVLGDPMVIDDCRESLSDVAKELEFQRNVLEAHWREPE